MGKIKKELKKFERIKLKLEESKEKVKKSRIEFQTELRKSLNTAIVAAFGFLIALAWKDVITEFVEGITRLSPVQGKFISALIITFVSVTGILIATKLISVKE